MRGRHVNGEYQNTVQCVPGVASLFWRRVICVKTPCILVFAQVGSSLPRRFCPLVEIFVSNNNPCVFRRDGT